MGKRTNTARWIGERWRIDVQKDGVRKSFYSSKPGRMGQREANEKADAWLDDNIDSKPRKVSDVYEMWMEDLQMTTSKSNWRPVDARWRNWVIPMIGRKKVNALTEKDLQDIVNRMYADGKSKKTLTNLCADLRAFCKFCRKAKFSTFTPEELSIPAGARCKEKMVLQPTELLVLFNSSETTYRGKVVEDAYINAYRFQVLVGLRPGELIGLRWEDVQGATLLVKRSVNVFGEETRGKNENAVRSVPLSALAMYVLEKQREMTGQNTGSIFEIRNEQHLYKRWRTYCTYHELTPCSLYEIRHTFVSVVKTLPAGEIKALVGHSQDMDTFGVYSHELAGDDQRTAQAVNDALAKLLKLA